MLRFSHHRVQAALIARRYGTADAGEFTFDQALTGARVIPGGEPFIGSAEYASPDSWTGSLAVSFPDQENVPLTGPGFTATLHNAVLPARAPSTP